MPGKKKLRDQTGRKPSLRKKQKARKTASKARELRRVADASERNNYSGKVTEGKAKRMRKKAANLSAKSRRAHNTSGLTSKTDAANRERYQKELKKKETAGKTPVKKKQMSKKEYEANKKVADYRAGKGRIKESGGDIEARGVNKGKGLGGEARVAGSAGTRLVREGYTASGRKTGSSQRVVREKAASKIGSRGIEGPQIKADMSGVEKFKTREKVKTASTLTPKGQTAGKPSAEGTTPKLKEKETAPLKMRPITSRVGR